jgi:hypothetical protein
MYQSEKGRGNHMQDDNEKAGNSACKELKEPGYQIQEQESG